MIRVLEEHVINQIAAGEVVERPASVVKELVENSLDAGAKVISVHLKNGGISMVRVVDDGRGMHRQDALMCLERHATSKIRWAEDLERVASLGFRGEAIPSIAAVGRFELLTRLADEEVGTRIRIDGGKLLDVSDAGCAAGTEISVRSLFFNLPARKKFLRTKATELAHCVEAVTRQALSRPDVDFRVFHEGREALRAPVVGKRGDRARDLLGDFGQSLVPVDFELDGFHVVGLVAPVGVTKGTAAGAQYLFVNGRFVRDAVIRRGLREAYRDLVPKGRHPVVVLDVVCDPAAVDVNVHPTKTEVRFREARGLTRALAKGVRAALASHGIQRPVERAGPLQGQPPLPIPASGPLFAAEPDPGDPRFSPARPATPSYAPPPYRAQPALPNHRPAPRPIRQKLDPRGLLPVERFRDLKVIGQYLDTYILCEGNGELVIVDQHAAHERVRLHELERDREERLGSAQRLLTPLSIELSRARADALAERVDLLESLHLEASRVTDTRFAITAVPAYLDNVDLGTLLADLADEAIAGDAERGEDIVHHFLATMACHSAIRAHDPLSDYEMRALLASLDEVDFEVCAHGRPVAIRVSASELEHRFHRS